VGYEALAEALPHAPLLLEMFKPSRNTYLHMKFLPATRGEWNPLGENTPTLYNILVRKGGRDHALVSTRQPSLVDYTPRSPLIQQY